MSLELRQDDLAGPEIIALLEVEPVVRRPPGRMRRSQRLDPWSVFMTLDL